MNGQITDCYPFPSPHPKIALYYVTYLSDGLRVKGLLAEPKAGDTYDGFLYLRGGIKNVGKVRPSRITQFASEGFIVFAPFYRGNQGGEGDEDFGGDDRYDAFSGFELLVNHPRVKEKRVHIFGFSRGGIMAIWTALQYSNATSIVTWGGVSDVILTYEEREELRRMMKRVIGGTPWKNPEGYQNRTPLYHLEKLNAPLLIIHGKKDRNVSIEHAILLEKLAITHGKKVETWYFEEFTHYFPPQVNRNVVRELSAWMKKQT
ncbi:prolyl oligopeptidase family serine peptidase [Caldibacillus lycopersici]|uniref:Prolyl oligopeptidase family serine peptidase n=1 Tax=Perspicuibacillus lycopersici TaxID=1325689 RepID=A0AAE3IVC6_9BACI|nr:prolyl oligopeptidase family serine peptidase [Perspicuibacillus lycopersici]MCU9614283.1 prolyl oligopeptidase family serine peptidase [Perspicuibacillus lycopersici]